MDDYPRPDWRRRTTQQDPTDGNLGWQSLNQVWAFAFDEADVGLKEKWYERPAADRRTFPREIRVPFAFQAKASGIGRREESNVVWYVLDVELSAGLFHEQAYDQQVMLNFGAVDYEATVWSAGTQVGHHRGGHVPFQIDFTSQAAAAKASAGPLNIVVRVEDRIQELSQPRGKQYWRPKSESIFYMPTTGIWQSVWLESVPRYRIERAILTPDIDRGTLAVEAYLHGRAPVQDATMAVCVTLGKLQVARVEKQLRAGSLRATFSVDMTMTGTVSPEDVLQQSLDSHTFTDNSIVPYAISGDTWQNGIALWTPERPALYDVSLIITDSSGATVDEVKTYTGMRKVSTEGGVFRLNNKPFFQRLILDQGYWPSSGLTPPNGQALRTDIEAMKAIGINGARKHQKVEDPRYLFWADRLGFLVWGEMANAYQFSQAYVDAFREEWTAAVRRDINHPCIVAWTPVNESWAHPAIATRPEQASFLRAMYHLTKSMDPSRLVIDNDGWEHVETDLMTVHDYADPLNLAVTCSTEAALLTRKASKDVVIAPARFAGQPIILSEFGGIAYDPDRLKQYGRAGGSEDWGYHTANDEGKFLQSLKCLVDAIIDGGVVQGFCYTQHSDIEQEVNGILTAGRQHKADPAKLAKIFGRKSHLEV